MQKVNTISEDKNEKECVVHTDTFIDKQPDQSGVVHEEIQYKPIFNINSLEMINLHTHCCLVTIIVILTSINVI